MKLLLFLALFFYTLSAKEFTLSASYNEQNSSYELKLRYHQVRTMHGLSYLVRYSVFKNNHFLHGRRTTEGASTEVGRMISCYEHAPTIIPLKTTQKQIGWIIEGYGLCGNTVSYNEEIIIPNTYGYLAKRILSKDHPTLFTHAYGMELYYFQQEWGGGGTAVSFYVPKRLTITEHFGSLYTEKTLLSVSDIRYLQKHIPDKYMLSFLGVFTAGMNEINPDIMQYALEHLYSSDDQKWYRYHYPKSSKDTFQEMVNQIQTARQNLNTAWRRTEIPSPF